MAKKRRDERAYTNRNKVQLLKGGKEYFTFLSGLLAKAEHSIYIRIYILSNDKTGTAIADQLVEAAKRKVAVYVIADGYASQDLPGPFIDYLKQNGVHFRFFEPLLRSTNFYFGRRLHEKVVVVDGRYATVAGINFTDRYNDIDNIPAWLDFALFIEGEAAYTLYKYCSSAWKKTATLPPPDFSGKDFSYSIRVRRNDWVKGKHNIWRTYFNWFNQSKESITIMCSYFLPGKILLTRLFAAAKRGVRVKVILAGKSDVMMAKHAERYLYRLMLKHKIDIYEYQPVVLHAKMMVVDNSLFTIGSYNVNNISTYASLELNVDVRNSQLALSVQETLNNIMDNECLRITETNFLSKVSIWKRLLQMSCYYLIRILLNVSTFYFKRE